LDAAQPPAPTGPLRLALVEDDPTIRELLHRYLCVCPEFDCVIIADSIEMLWQRLILILGSIRECGAVGFSPLQHLFPQHTTQQLLYLETKWASQMPYQKTADSLHDVLRLSAKLSGTTIQQHLHAVVEKQEQQLPREVAPFHGVCQRNHEALPCPSRPLVVGLNGGYIRHWHTKGCFEVIAGKSTPAEDVAKCFGFAQEVDAKSRRRVFEVLRSQGLQINQAL
jgi:hypothetical protein